MSDIKGLFGSYARTVRGNEVTTLILSKYKRLLNAGLYKK